MDTNGKTFWFPAKRYGWGWGPPVRWQGWVALALYAALLVLSAWTYLSKDDIAAFLACAIALTLALVVVLWLKGERPRWRWGDE